MIHSGWEVQVQPALFRMWRGDQEFNPFDAIEKLLAGKLSRQDWQARCRELEISDLVLLRDPKESSEGTLQLQAELLSIELPKG